MSKVRIITVGKIKDPALAQLEQDFLARLNKYIRIEIFTVKSESVSEERGNYAKEEEGKRILKNLTKSPEEAIIALDEHGEQFSSQEFAELLEKHKNMGENITFIIGGPFGLSKEVLQEADLILSLSSMTLLHEMAYTLLLEQIYRGYSIISGSSYHK